MWFWVQIYLKISKFAYKKILHTAIHKIIFSKEWASRCPMDLRLQKFLKGLPIDISNHNTTHYF